MLGTEGRSLAKPELADCDIRLFVCAIYCYSSSILLIVRVEVYYMARQVRVRAREAPVSRYGKKSDTAGNRQITLELSAVTLGSVGSSYLLSSSRIQISCSQNTLQLDRQDRSNRTGTTKTFVLFGMSLLEYYLKML